MSMRLMWSVVGSGKEADLDVRATRSSWSDSLLQDSRSLFPDLLPLPIGRQSSSDSEHVGIGDEMRGWHWIVVGIAVAAVGSS